MTDSDKVVTAEGYALANIDDLGDRYGFRKVRKGLGLTGFGANAIAIPPGYQSGFHLHEEQEELYFVHRGTIEFEFGDGTKHELGPGGVIRVDAAMPRRTKNVGDEDAVYLVVGGKGGYVGRDGVVPEGEDNPRGPGFPTAD